MVTTSDRPPRSLAALILLSSALAGCGVRPPEWPPGTGYTKGVSHRPAEPHQIELADYVVVISCEDLTLKGSLDGVEGTHELKGYIATTAGSFPAVPGEKREDDRLAEIAKHHEPLKAAIKSKKVFEWTIERPVNASTGEKARFRLHQIFESDAKYAHPGSYLIFSRKNVESGTELDVLDFNGDLCKLKPGVAVLVDRFGQFVPQDPNDQRALFPNDFGQFIPASEVGR